MQLIRAFNQETDVIPRVSGNVASLDLGVRISFKWAACTAAGGQYNYTPNADKTAAKHGAYRTAVLAEEERLGGDFTNEADFHKLVELDRHETRRFVNEWGRKFTDANKVVFMGWSVAEQTDAPIYDYLASPSWQGASAVLGIVYGRLADRRTFWEHVVAFATGGGPDARPHFFDANSGLYEFASGEDVATAIRVHIQSTAQDGRAIEAFNTLRLAHD